MPHMGQFWKLLLDVSNHLFSFSIPLTSKFKKQRTPLIKKIQGLQTPHGTTSYYVWTKKYCSPWGVQSTSQKAWITKGLVARAGWRSNPRDEVPLRYHNILFTTAQWESRGATINWQTLLTAKLISDLVRVAYCKAPTTDLYKVGSWKISAPCQDSLQLDTTREEIEWASESRPWG